MKQTEKVSPARLAWGTWNHETEREEGEGDINASYCAEKIACNEPIRKPFRFEGYSWVCVGVTNGGHEAYRLLPPELFEGTPTTYNQKTNHDGGETARNDPNGFYHGMTVKHGAKSFVLCGPPAIFVGDDTLPVVATSGSALGQLSMF